jgi:hypothetical protein
MILQNLAFEVFAHATRAMSARQQKPIECRSVNGISTQRRTIIRIGDHSGKAVARLVLRPHQKA